jgi:hypothetical protein
MNSNNKEGEGEQDEEEKEVEVEKHASALPDIAGMRGRCYYCSRTIIMISFRNFIYLFV